MMWDVLKGAGVVLLIALLIFAVVTMPARQQDQIKSWCADRDYEVISCRRPWFTTGPYWFVDTEHEVLYKTTVRNKRSGAQKVIWFKFNAFGMDYKEQ